MFDRLNNILNNDFGRVTYSDAVDILKKSGEKFEYPVEWGMDLQTEHERYLTEKVFGTPRLCDRLAAGDKSILYASQR